MKKSYNNPMADRLDFLPEDLFANGTGSVVGEPGTGGVPDNVN